MQMTTEDGREYWRRVLTTGGPTTIARWTTAPVTGRARHELSVPTALGDSLRGLATETATSLGTVLVAAHAKVLAVLSGGPEVVLGRVLDEGGGPLPFRMTTAAPTWRSLLRDARVVESEVVAHAGFPVGALAGELTLDGPVFETVVDPTGTGDIPWETLLAVAATEVDGDLRLVLSYRTDCLDAGAVSRIAGYHLTALERMAGEPDAEHERRSLVSDAEVAFQLEGLAGPRRRVPDERVHGLFEQEVRAHPGAVAVVCGDQQWTYSELNARANRVARALLARGLRREGVVAVVTERNLDWMAAVLAVFKAGGVYLPVQPQFPADRIATTLSRAGCRLVLTEGGSTATLDQALDGLPDVRTLRVDAAYDEGHDDHDLGVRVTADQAAYIYFTSGSTGEPKGAMCEHAGMMNHLLAKIDDLRIAPGRVVAQTAPQCFDISLWQLVSALLLGGRTLIVEQSAILDVERFVDTIVRGRVAVLQVVPSYLEAVLAYLEQHPRPLPDLHSVSVTGEALKKPLVQRWFAVCPEIVLVNAYGLTETSDDTNHEVMDRVPEEDRVPLGRPIPNVRVYVVDEHLVPVPLGAPGEIVFSGICVGRGYVNDPDRTRLAFQPDPHHEGERLYRAGDYGRWLPNGKLEFLGRRDSQVKISGFRIEIGDIETALLRVPGVRDGAVVVAERGDGAKHLVGFYTGPGPLETHQLQRRLADTVPDYMVPGTLHWQNTLPLTVNSKIDRKALTVLAGAFEVVEEALEEPRSASERRLAAAWSAVLGIPADRVGRHDHFFDRGGTSLAAVKLAIALDRAVSLKDVTRNPRLADLARVLDGRSAPSAPRPGLLHALSGADDAQTGALVCFPYAGGNAVNFAPMARALVGSGIAVYAVELPGHDPLGGVEPFQPLPQVVETVVAEIADRGLSRVMLWGHSSGSAFAWEAARQMTARGLDLRRVFLAAQLPGSPAERRAASADLEARTSAEILAALTAAGGYTELGALDAQRAALVVSAYRYDCLSAHHQLAEALDRSPTGRLTVPVTTVLAADDPHTRTCVSGYREWERLAEHVELHELEEGGHYFLRTKPAEAARAVLRAAELLTSS